MCPVINLNFQSDPAMKYDNRNCQQKAKDSIYFNFSFSKIACAKFFILEDFLRRNFNREQLFSLPYLPQLIFDPKPGIIAEAALLVRI